MNFKLVDDRKLLPGRVYIRKEKDTYMVAIVGRDEATLLKSGIPKPVHFEMVSELAKLDWEDISEEAVISVTRHKKERVLK